MDDDLDCPDYKAAQEERDDLEFDLASAPAASTWTKAGEQPVSLAQRFVTDGGDSVLIRGMKGFEGKGAIVRELKLAGSPEVEEFLTDAELVAALKVAGLPEIALRRIRCCVTATMKPTVN